MENASKALLIAGAILIVILLIAMGVRTLNSTSGTVESVETTMNATEVATHNNKFTTYIGTNKSLVEVKNLANTVIAHNKYSNFKVSFQGKNTANEIMQSILLLNENAVYTINVYDNNGDGLVDSITIA